MILRSHRLALLLLALPWAAAAGELHVSDAWVRLPPPATNAAAYLTLHNPTAKSRTLIGARSPSCERVEIHRSTIANGVARMEPAGPLDLPAGGSLEFEPNGLHLMLIRPRGLEENGRIEILLDLEGGDPLPFEAPVRRDGVTDGHERH